MKINTQISSKLIENSAEGVWVIDDTNKTIYVNHVLSQMLEFSQDDFRGKKISDFMKPGDSVDLDLKLESRKDGKSEHHELRFLKKSGSTIWVSAACSPITDEFNNYMGAVGLISDITERRKNEIILEAQRSVFEILIRGHSLTEALNVLVKPVESLVEGAIAMIQILDEEESLLTNAASLNAAPELLNLLNGIDVQSRSGACAEAALSRNLVVSENIPSDPLWDSWRERVSSFGIKSSWVIPITSGDHRVLGTVALFFKEPRKPTDYELNVMKNISSAAALSIEHSNLYQKVQKHNKEMSFLAKARETLNHTIEYSAVINCIPALIIEGGLGDMAFICLKGEDGVFRTESVSSRKDLREILGPFQNLELNLSSDMGLSKALRENKAYFQNTSPEYLLSLLKRTDPNAPNPHYIGVLHKLGLKSFIAVPLVVRDVVIGGMMVCSMTPEKKYRKSDLDLMIEVARSSASSIDNSLLYLESKKTVKAREEFISIASHELRTPMTSLKMRIDLLAMMIEKEQFPPEVLAKLRPVVSEIKPDVQKFSRLIETLLDISKLGAKRLSLSIHECDLSVVIQDEVERLKPVFEHKATPLSVEISKDLLAECDQVRIQQVVANLLMNALKFGEKKPVFFKTQVSEGTLIMEIKDQGIGISLEDQRRIFQPFERAVSDKHFGGLGLGLFITKQIVEGHRGSIEVYSSPGNGTTFIVRLPVLVK